MSAVLFAVRMALSDFVCEVSGIGPLWTLGLLQLAMEGLNDSGHKMCLYETAFDYSPLEHEGGGAPSPSLVGKYPTAVMIFSSVRAAFSDFIREVGGNDISAG
jgi:hypothetical protein